MNLLRALSLVFLILSLISGSVTMASARHQAGAVGEVVICTGYGLTTISLDAEGNPVTGEPILCPDCLPAFVALTGAPDPAARAPGTLTPLRHLLRATLAPVLPAPAAKPARGPPVAV
ncbi:MAG: hypothetical protein ACK4GT_08585 [Pararhodobacter sp.]